MLRFACAAVSVMQTLTFKVACSQSIPPCLSFFVHFCLLSAFLLKSPNLPDLPNLPYRFDFPDFS